MRESPSVQIYDEERANRWRALKKQYDGSQSNLLRELIDEAAEERVDDVEDVLSVDEQESVSIVDTYTPSDYEGSLSREEVEEIVRESGGDIELNPSHVPQSALPSKQSGLQTETLAAIVRHEYDEVDRSTVKGVVKEYGMDTAYYLDDRDVPSSVICEFSEDYSVSRTEREVTVSTRDIETVVEDCIRATFDPEQSCDVMIVPDSVEENHEKWEAVEDEAKESRVITDFVADVVGTATNEQQRPKDLSVRDGFASGRRMVDWYCDTKDRADWPDDTRDDLAEELDGWRAGEYTED